MNGYGIHRIHDIYHPNCQAGLPDGRWVMAVQPISIPAAKSRGDGEASAYGDGGHAEAPACRPFQVRFRAMRGERS